MGSREDPRVPSHRAPTATQLSAERFQRALLRGDARQAIAVVAVIALATVLYIRNDLLLLRGTNTLAVVIGVRAVTVAVCMVAIVVLARARRPSVKECAVAVALAAITITTIVVTKTRQGELQGAVLANIAFLVAMYFGLRGSLWTRGLAAFAVSVATIVSVSAPVARLSRIGQNSTFIAVIAMNVIGLYSARTFEEERKKRWEAERKERRLRFELAQRVAELDEEKERALAMSRAKSTFLATMSHEFRTPMNAVIGLSDLLVGAPIPGEPREHARTIRESARALLSLIDDILDFTKSDSDELTLLPRRFDVRALGASVIDMLRPQAETGSLALTLEIAPDVPAWLTGDEARLRQVLVNLVSNGLKFTEQGKVTLRIGARSHVNRAEVDFAVEDTGIGIAADAVERLFQPFEQLDQGITRRYGGSGLGLAISKRIVSAMGGELRVESTEGRGSVFSFTVGLPLADPPSLPPRATAQELSGPAPLSILLVDDHALNQRVGLAMLRKLGYSADLASNGLEAIEATRRKEYDVILMDLQMPEMSGVDAARIILRDVGGHAPEIVAMTAGVLEEDRAACREVGMTGFIPKPVDRAELARVLERISLRRGATTSDVGVAELDGKRLDALRELERAGEPGLVADVIRDFGLDTRARLGRMVRASDAGRARDLEREAHTVKSASASLGATELARLASELEVVARTATPESLRAGTADTRARIGALAREFERVARALAREP